MTNLVSDKLTLQNRLEMWGYHCNDLENTLNTIKSLLKTAEKATLAQDIEQEDLTCIFYTISMCSELLGMVEAYSLPLYFEQYNKEIEQLIEAQKRG